MTLKRYLAQTGISHVAFAKMVGVTDRNIRNWVTGYCHPRLEVAAKIEDITGGAVKMRDFLKAPR